MVIRKNATQTARPSKHKPRPFTILADSIQSFIKPSLYHWKAIFGKTRKPPATVILQRLILKAYAKVNQTGVLDRPLAARLFQWAYFTYKKVVEDPFERFAKRYPEFFQGGHIIDVGANIGYTAQVFAKRLTPGFKVFAFEPEERNFRFLRDGLRRSQYSELVLAVQVAVGSRNGSVSLWLNPAHHADHRVRTDEFGKVRGSEDCRTVPLLTVDEFLGGRPPAPVAFVKIDVQGYELEVCRGLTATLASNSNLSVAFEYAPQQMEELGFVGEDLLAFFVERGFRLYALNSNGTLTPMMDAEVSDFLKKQPYFDILATRAEVGN